MNEKPTTQDLSGDNWLDEITMHPDLEGARMDTNGIRLITRRVNKDEVDVAGPYGNLLDNEERDSSAT